MMSVVQLKVFLGVVFCENVHGILCVARIINNGNGESNLEKALYYLLLNLRTLFLSHWQIPTLTTLVARSICDPEQFRSR